MHVICPCNVFEPVYARVHIFDGCLIKLHLCELHACYVMSTVKMTVGKLP